MVKGTFENYVTNRKLDYEYDNKTYIVGFNEKNYLNIKRIEGNGGNKEFNEDVLCFVQVNKNERNYFLVGSYYNKKYEISIYEDDESFDNLQLRNRFNMNEFFNLDDIRLREDTFIVDKNETGGRIYTIGDEKPTKLYERIYNDKRITDLIKDKNILLVDELYSCECENGILNDRITFGIDIDTKKIVTGIKSSLKRGMINTYTKEDVERLKEKIAINENEEYDYEDEKIINGDYSLEEITKYFEIERYFRFLYQYFSKNEGLYKYTKEGPVINKEYIMKFVPTNKE